MSWLDKVTKDPRPLYLISFIALVFPLIYPIVLPLKVSQGTYGIYDFIKNMKPEERILLTGSWDYKFGELYPQFAAVLEHCIQKQVKIVILEFGTTVPTWTEEAFKDVRIRERMKYGVDYVDLGYIPGGEVMVAGLCKDFQSIVKEDYYGNKIADLPITKDIKSIKDIKGIICFTGSADSQYWLNQAWAPYGVKVAHALLAGKVMDSEAYFRAGSIFGILNGIRGAAEYESLVSRPGVGLGQMGSISFSAMVVVLALIVGTFVHLRQKMTGGGKK